MPKTQPARAKGRRPLELRRLWAPWRRRFLTHDRPKGCIFCEKPRLKGAQAPRRSLIVRRGETAFVILNLYPYNNGHLMIAPYRHVASPAGLTETEALEMHRLVGWALKKLDKLLKPHGYNIGMNIGRAAGAGFDAHAHLHVVPRWNGDTNFMPVAGGVKVISQALEELRKSLIF